MAAMFAGASRALLASVVFAFETTRQPIGLLPLLSGCTAAFLASCLLMQHTIMTEKIARRGVRVLGEYTIDYLDMLSVKMCASTNVVTLRAQQTLGEVRAWLSTGTPETEHQGFPVVGEDGKLAGVVTWRDLQSKRPDGDTLAALIRRPAVVIPDSASLRDAADLMAREKVGRLPVVDAAQRMTGILTRSDIISAHETRLDESTRREASLRSAFQ
jgi:CBS domain-containing protein